MPESDPARDVALGAALGLLGSVPGLGAIAGGAQAALAAASRQRDEEWGAMVGARLRYLEENGAPIDFSDPDFVAAVHRLSRAAQETDDERKRRAYAGMLANSGSWSQIPSEERERMERLVRDLSSREILLLLVFRDPESWWEQIEAGGPARYRSQTVMDGISGFINGHVGRFVGITPAQAKVAIDELERRGLASIPYNTSMAPDGVLAKRSTQLGDQLLAFINSAEQTA
jgi:hypothetical protein